MGDNDEPNYTFFGDALSPLDEGTFFVVKSFDIFIHNKILIVFFV
jgi:hypothetical protein